MTCPVCAGETNPRELLLRSLCKEHLAEVPPIPGEVLRAAFEEGLRMRQACIDAYVPPILSDLRFR